MEILDLFSGSQMLAQVLRDNGHNVTTVDFHQYRSAPVLTHNTNIFDFEYRAYSPEHFDFIFIGLPCTTFSKASGGHHFKNNIVPVTNTARESILMIGLIYELLKYFNFPPFMLENPMGGLRNNFFFKNHCYFSQVTMYSTSFGAFGFPTQKKTDLFTNIDFLILFPTSYRVNGRYQKKPLCNLTKKQKSSYPIKFCEFVADFLNPLKEKTSSGATRPQRQIF
jgi:hypothetical protein